MRILMASHGYPPTISGVTLVVQKLAREMVRRGHTVVVVTASDREEPYQDVDQGVQLNRVRSMANPFFKEAPVPIVSRKDLENIYDALQPDILHVHDAAWLGLQCARLAKNGADLPVLTTSYYVPRFVARYLSWNGDPQPLVEDVVWFYSTWFFNQFDHVVFATEAHRRVFQQQGMEAVTSIISNGMDLNRYTPNGDCAGLEELGLPRGRRILFVGRLAQDKEIDTLIRAMPAIRAEEDAHLLLVGRGDYRPELEELAAELDLQGAVHFMGFVPERLMPALYRAVDLFAIASTCEVQSLPTLQAVACGVPVVAADAVALPELVHHGVNGFLVPPYRAEAIASAILRILQDGALAERMGRAGLDIAEPHAEEHTFDLYEALYHEMAHPAVLEWADAVMERAA
ncbi:MAG: glycosyltransferase [Chloroflexia bacterium]|nr:glycosyltransferase [Chloroflexia bacterium]